jgi:hypothetical protein
VWIRSPPPRRLPGRMEPSLGSRPRPHTMEKDIRWCAVVVGCRVRVEQWGKRRGVRWQGSGVKPDSEGRMRVGLGSAEGGAREIEGEWAAAGLGSAGGVRSSHVVSVDGAAESGGFALGCRFARSLSTGSVGIQRNEPYPPGLLSLIEEISRRKRGNVGRDLNVWAVNCLTELAASSALRRPEGLRPVQVAV